MSSETFANIFFGGEQKFLGGNILFFVSHRANVFPPRHLFCPPAQLQLFFKSQATSLLFFESQATALPEWNKLQTQRGQVACSLNGNTAAALAVIIVPYGSQHVTVRRVSIDQIQLVLAQRAFQLVLSPG